MRTINMIFFGVVGILYLIGLAKIIFRTIKRDRSVLALLDSMKKFIGCAFGVYASIVCFVWSIMLANRGFVDGGQLLMGFAITGFTFALVGTALNISDVYFD